MTAKQRKLYDLIASTYNPQVLGELVRKNPEQFTREFILQGRRHYEQVAILYGRFMSIQCLMWRLKVEDYYLESPTNAGMPLYAYACDGYSLPHLPKELITEENLLNPLRGDEGRNWLGRIARQGCLHLLPKKFVTYENLLTGESFPTHERPISNLWLNRSDIQRRIFPELTARELLDSKDWLLRFHICDSLHLLKGNNFAGRAEEIRDLINKQIEKLKDSTWRFSVKDERWLKHMLLCDRATKKKRS